MIIFVDITLTTAFCLRVLLTLTSVSVLITLAVRFLGISFMIPVHLVSTVTAVLYVIVLMYLATVGFR